jgi:hypothetical protein
MTIDVLEMSPKVGGIGIMFFLVLYTPPVAGAGARGQCHCERYHETVCDLAHSVIPFYLETS